MKKLLLALLSLCIISCSKGTEPEPKLTSYIYKLNQGETAYIKGENLDNVIFESDYNYVASVNGRSIKANYVGEAFLKSVDSRLSCKVEVIAKHELFTIEYWKDYFRFAWGTPMETIEYRLNGLANNYFLQTKTYDNNIPYVIYHFDYNNKLDYYALVVKLSYGTKLVDYLAERYEPLQQVSTYDFAFIHRDKKDNPDLLVYVSISTSQILVIYMPPTKTKAGDIDLEALHRMVENKIN